MKNRLIILCAAGLIVPLAACGDDGGSGGGSPEAAASRSVDHAQAFHGAADDPSGEGPLAAALQLFGDAQLMASSAQLETATGGLSTHQAGLSADCVSEAGGTITYSDCGVQGSTFNGTVTVQGNQATLDLTMEIDPSKAGALPAGAPAGPVEGVTVRELGTLNVTPTRIDGTIEVAIATRVSLGDVALPDGIPGLGSTIDVNTDIDVIFDVDLDAGCAVGGTLTVVSSMGGLGGDTTTTATFGPACGDVSVQ